MIKVSYEEPLGYGSTISFNINGRKFTGTLYGFSDKTYIFPRAGGKNLVSTIENDLRDNLKNFFSKVLETPLDKYKTQYWPEESIENLKKVLKAMEESARVKGVEFEKPLGEKSKVTFITSYGVYESTVNTVQNPYAFIWLNEGNSGNLIDKIMRNLCGESIRRVYSRAGAAITRNGTWPYSTLEDLEKVLDYINEECLHSVQKPINNPIKQQQNGNEIKLQRTKGIIRSGKVPKGCGICGKIHKATISSRPLENSAISG